MPNDIGRRPSHGQLKLRTSCDACGAAKLKCDRLQPACGRCVSHGLSCVYGVSRKMGKPPRHKLRQALQQAPSHQIEPSPAKETNNPGLWDTLNPNAAVTDSNNLAFHIDAFATSTQPLPTLASFDFGDWSDINHLQNILSSDPELHPASPVQSPNTRDSYNPKRVSDHGCVRKAYEILGGLCFNLHAMPVETSSGNGSCPNEVSLGHVLRTTREASEQLVQLLDCSCASSPSIAFLHASIIARIFTWYYDATLSIYNISTRPISSSNSSVSGSASTGSSSSSACPSTAATSIASASIAIGSFSVDDRRVDAAVKIQLLLGEMRRVTALSSHFIVQGDDARHDRGEPESVDSLFQSLNSWLTREHSRVINIIKTKLRDLNS